MGSFNKFSYFCVDGFRQYVEYPKSLSSFLEPSGFPVRLFLLPVLSWFLPSNIQISCKKKPTLKFPYTLAKSACNDLTVSTGDLEVSKTGLINAFRDMQVKERFWKKNAYLN